jgi:hypothetical protein
MLGFMSTTPGAATNAIRAGRILLASLGAASFVAGTVAVFVSAQVPGTITLLTVGAILFTIAVLGLSPKNVKFGDKQLEFKDILYAEKTRETVEEAISDKAVAEEDRENLAELIVRMNERFNEQVGVVPASAKKLAIEAYIAAVHGALRRATPREYAIEEFDDNSEVCFLIRCSGVEVYVDCSLGVETTERPMPVEIVRHYVELSKSLGCLLIVSNRPPEEAPWEESTSDGFKSWSRASASKQLEFVKWTGPAHDEPLRVALERICRD